MVANLPLANELFEKGSNKSMKKAAFQELLVKVKNNVHKVSGLVCLDILEGLITIDPNNYLSIEIVAALIEQQHLKP